MMDINLIVKNIEISKMTLLLTVTLLEPFFKTLYLVSTTQSFKLDKRLSVFYSTTTDISWWERPRN